MHQDTTTVYRRTGRQCRTCRPQAHGGHFIVLIGRDRAFAMGPPGIHQAENLVDARDWARAHGARRITFRPEPPGFLKNPPDPNQAPQRP